MCGLCGFISSGKANREQLTTSITAMNQQLLHRGPDDGGYWLDETRGIALGHRRLAIQDLSPAGHQPMQSSSGNLLMVFNGEIYNFRELRAELQRGNTINWRGHSDTEILLQAIQHWGLEKTLAKTVGMFALAVWDRQQQILYLARDRLGEKPLYYGFQQGVFMFASQLQALKKHPAWQGRIDRDALALLLRFNCIPSPYAIFKNIRKLPPGSFLSMRLNQLEMPQPVSYWSLHKVVGTGHERPFSGSAEAAVEQLDGVLKQAVAGQMLADVPLGAFLSGGYDSSLVVALMQQQSARPVKTFAIGFHESGYNEAEYAQAVAEHLGTEHTALYVSGKQAMDVIPDLPAIYDEPFADVSQLPTFLVAQLAKQSVSVALSGDGGDELFGGYSRYLQIDALWRRLSWLPLPLRHLAAQLISLCPVPVWDKLFALLGPVHEALQAGRAGDRMHKLAELITAHSSADLYSKCMSHWQQPEHVVLQAQKLPRLLHKKKALENFLEQMMYVDARRYLPDDILVKVDRAAMAVSLETRIPLLDHRVVEFAWRLPLAMKIRSGQGKWLLRQVLYQYVPRQLLDRPKQGFAVPLDKWLRGPLRDWAEALLDAQKLQQQGFFDVRQVRLKWQEHLSGARNWHYYLWDILMFQAWLEAQ